MALSFAPRHRHTLARYAIVCSVWGAGCSLIVPGDLPDYKCTGEAVTSCPSGMTCDTATLRCVAFTSIPDESSTGDEDDVPAEGGTDDVPAPADQDVTPQGPAALGEICAVGTDCKSGMCGSSTVLTTTIVPSTSKPICTQTCCTSSDCPTDFVCFDGGTGGNYCVPASKASRTPPASGGKTGGSACNGNNECRSGLCSTNKCLDTCCSQSDCAGGAQCRIKTVSPPEPSHDIWVCQPAEPGATKSVGTACGVGGNGECLTDVCIGISSDRKCRPSCCSRASCISAGFPDGQCAYGDSGNDHFKFCFSTTATSAGAKGAVCVADTDCQSHYCDPELRKCAEVCCEDSDCLANEQCIPSASGTPFLRCVARR